MINKTRMGGLLCGLCVLAWSLHTTDAQARPVTYPDGRVWVMDAQDNQQAWRFGYSKTFRWSASVGGLYLNELANGESLDVTYVRAARLLKRWNWPNAQANLFGWGGVGYAKHTQGTNASGHVGFQADFETRTLYTSVVSEHHEGQGWRYRTDTLSIGAAPYAHDFDGVAAWVILKGMRTTHTLKDKPKGALMLRFFNPTWWIEAGIDSNGRLLGNLMFNF
jgi:hypothetical protein